MLYPHLAKLVYPLKNTGAVTGVKFRSYKRKRLVYGKHGYFLEEYNLDYKNINRNFTIKLWDSLKPTILRYVKINWQNT